MMQHTQIELPTEPLTIWNFRRNNCLVAQFDVTYLKHSVLIVQVIFSSKKDQILTNKCHVNNYHIIIIGLPISRPMFLNLSETAVR